MISGILRDKQGSGSVVYREEEERRRATTKPRW
jgi:hypothetical protein